MRNVIEHESMNKTCVIPFIRGRIWFEETELQPRTKWFDTLHSIGEQVPFQQSLIYQHMCFRSEERPI